MQIFVQNQGMRKILPQAYGCYSEDEILSITQRLGEKIILQEAQMDRHKRFILTLCSQSQRYYPNRQSHSGQRD